MNATKAPNTTENPKTTLLILPKVQEAPLGGMDWVPEEVA